MQKDSVTRAMEDGKKGTIEGKIKLKKCSRGGFYGYGLDFASELSHPGEWNLFMIKYLYIYKSLLGR